MYVWDIELDIAAQTGLHLDVHVLAISAANGALQPICLCLLEFNQMSHSLVLTSSTSSCSLLQILERK